MKRNHKNQKLNKNTISLNSIPQPHPRLNENKAILYLGNNVAGGVYREI